MTQEQTRVICREIISLYYKQIYKRNPDSIINATNRIITDIEENLHIIYNGNRTSIVEAAWFIYKNIRALSDYFYHKN